MLDCAVLQLNVLDIGHLSKIKQHNGSRTNPPTSVVTGNSDYIPSDESVRRNPLADSPLSGYSPETRSMIHDYSGDEKTGGG